MYGMKAGNLEFVDGVDSFVRTAKAYKTLEMMATCIVRALIAKIRSNLAMLSRSASICCLGVLCPTIKFGTNTVRMVRTNLPKS